MPRLLSLLAFLIGCANASELAPSDGSIQPGQDASRVSDASDRRDASVDAQRPHDGGVGDAREPSCTMAFTGVLASWSFTGLSGSQASTAAGSAAPGITPGAVSRSTAISATAGADSINSSDWTTSSSRDDTRYYTFSIAPPAGCELTLTSLSIDTAASATGPGSAEVATSADNFTTTATVAASSSSTPTLTVTNATTAIELRVYGFAASGTAGTMRIKSTLSVSGSLH
jgi:hypothetical protein